MPFVGRLRSPYQPTFSQGFQQVGNLISNLMIQKIQQNFREKEATIQREHEQSIAETTRKFQLQLAGGQEVKPKLTPVGMLKPTGALEASQPGPPGQREPFVDVGDKTYRVPKSRMKTIGMMGNFAVQQKPDGTIVGTRLFDLPRGGTNVAVDVGGKGGAELAKKMGEELAARHTEVSNIALNLTNLQPIKSFLRGPMITGTGANQILGIAKALQQVGAIEPGSTAEEAITNTQAYAAQMGNQVAQIIKQFGAGTGLSDADREYAEKIAGGKITLTKKALIKIVGLNEKAMVNVIKEHNKKARQVMNKPWAKDLPYSLIIDVPSTIDFSRMSDDELLKRLGR